jgi:four helix bundle protein
MITTTSRFTVHQQPYQKLIAWQEAHKLCLWIYKATESFPAHERFRLVSQMCSSAPSVPTNIVEGSAKDSAKERSRFYEISQCSLEELHYQCLLARGPGYLSQEDFEEVDRKVQRTSFLIVRLRASLK